MDVDITIAEHYVTVDGHRIRYLEAGSGEPLLLIHGMFVSADIWEPCMALLARSRRVIAIDIPGFGQSECPTRPDMYSLDYVGRFFSMFIDALALGRVDVAGNSLGGYVATRLALAHPGVVRNLVIVDAAGYGRDMVIALKLLSLPGIGELVAIPSRVFIRLIMQNSVADMRHVPAAMLDRLFDGYRRPGCKAAQLRFLRLGLGWRGQTAAFSDAELAGLQAPTLVLWGAEDVALPLSHARHAVAAIPGATLKIFDGAGHSPMVDDPGGFAAAVADFVG